LRVTVTEQYAVSKAVAPGAAVMNKAKKRGFAFDKVNAVVVRAGTAARMPSALVDVTVCSAIVVDTAVQAPPAPVKPPHSTLYFTVEPTPPVSFTTPVALKTV